MLLTGDIRDYAGRSVLCWLASVSEDGPSVSPKEIFACYGEDRIIIDNIASPQSIKNIRHDPRVCVSFVDVFSQKGWQLYGRSVLLKNGDDGFAKRQAILQGMAGDAFKVGMVIDVAIDQAREIIAPSYRFRADVNEADMRAGAMATYGVRPVD